MRMKQKKITKESKHRLMLFGTISCVIVFYCLFNFISYTIKVNNLKEIETNLNNKLISLQDEGSNLKNEIKKLKDPDYLARYARENFLYSKDDEYIIKIEDKEEETNEVKKEGINYKTITFISSSLTLFVIMYIVKKNKR